MAARSTLQRLAVFAVLFGLLATACGSTGTETEAAAPAEAGETAESSASEAAGANPLSGEFGTVSGETVDLATYQGQDVVLWFWAPW